MTNTVFKKPLVFVACLLIQFGFATSAYADQYYKTVELKTKPGQREAFVEFMKIHLADTRSFEGSEYVALLVDKDSSDTIFLYEIWESQEASDAYSKWRADTNFGSLTAPYVAGPPVRHAYSLEQE